MAQASIPFMWLKDGKTVVSREHGNQVVDMPDDWTGVCRADQKFWFLGQDRSSGDRSFSVLASKNYDAALREAAKIDRHERLQSNRSSVTEFLAALGQATGGNALPVMDTFGPFKACTEFDAIRKFAVQSELSVTQKEQAHQLAHGWAEMLDRSARNTLSQAEYAQYQDAQTSAEKGLAASLADNHTFLSLTGSASNGLRVQLLRDPEADGWKVERADGKGLVNFTGYKRLEEAVLPFLREVGGSDVTLESAPWVKGDTCYTDPATGTIYFIADNIERGREVPTLMRELCKHRASSVLDQEVKEQLLDQLNSWALCPGDSQEFKVYHSAHKRSTAFYGAEGYQEHLFAYAVEEAAALGIKPSMKAGIDADDDWVSQMAESMGIESSDKAGPGSVEAWLSQIEDVVKRFYDHANMLSDSLDMQDLVDFAYVMNAMDHPQLGFEVRARVAAARDEVLDLAELQGKPLFGYFINLDERGSFQADVRDKDGTTLYEVRGGDELQEDDESLVSMGYMSDFHDTTGLQGYLQQMGVLSADAQLMPSADFEQALDRLPQGFTVMVKPLAQAVELSM